jgi:hypothetical protein
MDLDLEHEEQWHKQNFELIQKIHFTQYWYSLTYTHS